MDDEVRARPLILFTNKMTVDVEFRVRPNALADLDIGAVLPALVVNTLLDKITLLDTKLDNVRLVVLICDVTALTAASRALPTVLAVAPIAAADAV